MQNAEHSVVDLTSDAESDDNLPEAGNLNRQVKQKTLAYDDPKVLCSNVAKRIEELFDTSAQCSDKQDKDLRSIETDFGLLDFSLKDSEELCDYVLTKVDKLSIHLSQELTFDDTIRKTDDGFLVVNGPFQKILPISVSSHKVIREASYSSDKQFELTGSSTGFGITEDILPDNKVITDIDIMEPHNKLYLHENYDINIERPPLKMDDDVYACTGAVCSNNWKLAVIQNVDTVNNMFTVKFIADFMPSIRLPAKKLAYTTIPPVTLKIGLRVIAHFKKERSDPSSNCPLLSGMIAEIPKISNNKRYLIFFDDGRVSYVAAEEVFLIVEDSCPWDEIDDKDYKQFIQRYCDEFPEKRVMKFQEGEKVKVRLQQKWVLSIVQEVDCSLVKMKFDTNNETEWLYRGSIRLYPIYSKLIEIEKLRESNKSKPQRKCSRKSSRSNINALPYIEYTVDTSEEENVSRYINTPKAKKRITKLRDINEWKLLQLNRKTIVAEIPALFTENVERYVSHENHDCWYRCIVNIDENIRNFKDCNPFAIPIMCKWIRDFYADFRFRQRTKSRVRYITPCGVELFSIADVYKYLQVTRSKLPIDCFSFEASLQIYSKEPMKFLPYYYNPDLTSGKEFHKISVVNEIDDEKPDEFEYSEKCVAGQGVSLRFDNDFLSCCNCTDNCIDRNKCRCQQITIEVEERECGYVYRRLYGSVHTGVFECNALCACNEQCVNRVAQLGIRVQLQLFKTKHKGWGVRVLHDVPRGSFICTYSAEVISDTSLLEDDKYFADLDLIDICEMHKHGYESSVEECSEDESDGKPRKRMKTYDDYSSVRSNSENEKFEIRKYFGEDFSYTLDAQRVGNIGRYLNHSCDPNCFVQSVFFETHDLRFPCVAIFACKNIKALDEITWDYNYVVDSVPGKKLWCECGTQKCRGRLL